MEEKFCCLTGLVLDQNRLEALIDMLWHLEWVGQVSQWSRMLLQ